MTTASPRADAKVPKNRRVRKNLLEPRLRGLLALMRNTWRTLTSMGTALVLLFLLALGAIPGARAFLFAGFGVFDVDHAAAFAAVEDETTFHNSDFLSEVMKLNVALDVSATPNGQRSPPSRVIAEFYRSSC